MAKKQIPRKIIREEIKELEWMSLFSSSIDETLSSLKKIKEEAKISHPKYAYFELDSEQNFDEFTLKLIGVRQENDEEYNKRLARIAGNSKGGKAATIAKKAKQAAKDLKEYQRLQKKLFR